MLSKQTTTDTPKRTTPPIIAGIICMILAGCGGIASGAGQGESTRFVAEVEPSDDQAVCGKADLSKLKSLVYVSPKGVDNGTCGTSVAGACKSIQQGIKRCADAAGCGVLAEYGLYSKSKTLQLGNGVHVYGGCRFNAVAASSSDYHSLIEAPTGGFPAVKAANIDQATTFQGFLVRGSDAGGKGQPTVAMLVEKSSKLTLRDNTFVAARGSRGKDGADAIVGTHGIDAGTAPNKGTSTCRAAGGDGGARWYIHAGYNPFWTCNHFDGVGGLPGSAGEAGGTNHRAPGGTKGTRYVNCSCFPSPNNTGGNPGGPGSKGTCGAPGAVSEDVVGSFSGPQWFGSVGGPSDPGRSGGGGGGGGPGGPCGYMCLGAHTIYGGAGGGGGAGGCGASKAHGGWQGGASFALLLVDSSVSIEDSSIVSGVGGDGGTGGDGKPGGKGGAGHAGEAGGVCPGICNCHGKNGGPGGNGGTGGASGGGAGGNGGPSIGIAKVAGSSVTTTQTIFYKGTSGARGGGGSGGEPAVPKACKGAPGNPGKVADTYSF